MIRTSDVVTDGRHGTVPLRVYQPDSPAGPVLVWMHGGGFVNGSIDGREADWVARELAARGVTVVTVGYRLVTDTVTYPVPSDDVLSGYAWAVDHAAELTSTPSVHIGGASAGANLALGAVLRIRDEPGVPTSVLPASVVLAYPTLHAVQPDPDADLAKALSAIPAGFGTDTTVIVQMYRNYTGCQDVEGMPGPAVPGGCDLAGLPPIIIVSSDVDMVRPSAEAFARRLAAARTGDLYVVEPGTRHGHLTRPEEPQGVATIERFTEWLTAGRFVPVERP